MNYEQALAFIHATPNLARAAGLGRIQALLQRLGNPQNALRFVHIAGTNGKGSTAAMLASVLQSAGYRTGLYTSPYLQDFRERIRLNGQLIPREALAALCTRLQPCLQELAAAGIETPNEFELVTALALCWYAEQGAELVVLEVGLGGRFDATNVIPPPLACAITSISLDHTGVLGSTVEEIAREKAGILKPGSLCALAPGQRESVAAVIEAEGHAVGCPVLPAALPQGLRFTREGLSFLHLGRRMELPLLGDYQAENLATVLRLVELLQLRGLAISESALRAGLAAVRWPGRLELCCGGRLLLDCCHNPDGVAALCRTLARRFPGAPITAVMGMLGDKDYQSAIALLARRSRRFFAVAPPSPRAPAAAVLARAAAAHCAEVQPCTELSAALSLALSRREEDGLVVVCGSIPLVGEARTLLQGRGYLKQEGDAL